MFHSSSNIRMSVANVTSTASTDSPKGNEINDNRFSIMELRRLFHKNNQLFLTSLRLHETLVQHKEKVNKDNEHLIVEVLRVIAEMVVYGDRYYISNF